MAQAWGLRLADPSARAGFIEISHVVIGVLILVLTGWRLVLRATHGVPSLPPQENVVLGFAAKLSHGCIILSLIVMSISGLAAWFGIVAPAGMVHRVVQVLVYALVGSHIAAALMHQYVLRDGLLSRIVRPEV
jgi:cytochrome b561